MENYCSSRTEKSGELIYWKIFLRNDSFVWRSLPLFVSKRELIQFLHEFNSKKWIKFGNIVQAKIVRLKRIASTMMWQSEVVGYVDVTSAGYFNYIDL